jgi:tripartite-type tricarboxylate transporter receptor subunit TctC
MKKNFDRRWTAGFALIAALAAPPAGHAQTWPGTKPISIVMGYGPGSGADVEARLFAPFLQSALGVPVIVEGKPGAGGIIGTEYVAKAAPDGHTFLLSTGGIATFKILNKQLSFDPIADLDPVTCLNETASLLVTNKDVPAKDLREFVAYVKANPGKVNYASAGRNTILLVMESLKLMANIQMTEIAYKGQGDYLTALSRNEVQLAMASPSGAKAMIDEGRLKPLVALGEQRISILPGVATAAQQDFPALRGGGWYGILAPRGTPKAIVDRIAAEGRKFAQSAPQQERAQKGGFSWVASTPEQFRRQIAEDVKFYSDVAKRANIQPE